MAINKLLNEKVPVGAKNDPLLDFSYPQIDIQQKEDLLRKSSFIFLYYILYTILSAS